MDGFQKRIPNAKIMFPSGLAQRHNHAELGYHIHRFRIQFVERKAVRFVFLLSAVVMKGFKRIKGGC